MFLRNMSDNVEDADVVMSTGEFYHEKSGSWWMGFVWATIWFAAVVGLGVAYVYILGPVK